MSGVFKDLENKTKFAIFFTKHYQALYRDFVRDDHYRSVSATAVTVQIYTVTSVVSSPTSTDTICTVTPHISNNSANNHYIPNKNNPRTVCL